MHSGHYNAIRQAKMICDVLVVGVHSDAEIADNKALPVMRQDERYELLKHIKWIDEIVRDVPYSPLISTLEGARADFCIHGDDMPVNAQGICAYDEMKDAGKLRIVKRTEGVSTTDLIGRLLTLARQEHRDGDFDASKAPQKMDADAVMNSAFNSFGASSKACSDASDLVGRLAQKWTRAPVQLLASTRRISEFSSAKQPKEGDRVVYVSGAFDMFHVGHAEFLKEAKEMGTFLCVGIHDDRTVSSTKGACFPVMTLNERVLNVCACKWVDEVVIGAPRDVTEDLIKTWNIQVVAQGSDHQRCENLISGDWDKHSIPKRLGIFREVTSKWPHLCHDTVVGRIIEEREAYLKRNRDRARREDVYYNSKEVSNSPL
eukprot:CAMPEP_0183608918 /NCGR_PEP_ID=MMETSP0371-20130417/184202_1 /TAXON_ID=268820 /ORGANISM="Peridinium aciculiferum, Strain PAER-2" /LENGTH=373 /DNA_ID=CAMNT_0025821045 /DNA_START=41 /DNA_END=1158 /DNA_ORIENTATION=+